MGALLTNAEECRFGGVGWVGEEAVGGSLGNLMVGIRGGVAVACAAC